VNDRSSEDALPRQPKSNAILAGIRVLEIGDEIGQLCGKLLAELGADVIKIEPPHGSSVRRAGPFLHDSQDKNQSLSFWHYNTSKRSITLDLEDAAARDILRSLALGADVVLDSLAPGELQRLGAGYESLAAEQPAVIYCSMTPFGGEGPWAGYQSSDLVQLALGGVMAGAGYNDVPEAPPIAPTGGHSWHLASLYAANAIAMAMFHRLRGGGGQHIDIAVHDCVAVTTESSFFFYAYNGGVPQRQTGRHALIELMPPQNHRTSDGRYINALMVAVDTRRWVQVVALLQEFDPEEVEDLADDIYLIPEILQERMWHVSEVIGRFIVKHTAEEIYRRAQARKLPWSPIRAVEDFQDDPHLRDDRQFFQQVEHPELDESYAYTGAILRFSRTPFELRRRAPTLGEHNVQNLGSSWRAKE
jgi:crotonobetainyl-CoA:carnitine CoA-transferase CaiB-like acyl-CoA transferase